MANEARITRRWPDGDSLFITIVADDHDAASRMRWS